MSVTAIHHERAPGALGTLPGDAPRRRLRADGEDLVYDDQLAWNSAATLFGLPATAVPIGLSAGLPVGAQLIGPYLEDRTTLAFAALLEQVCGGFVVPPAGSARQAHRAPGQPVERNTHNA
jgi:Asp-tRNA(Asn)/Glu-tRNA(Gln) amidotransferase A subunit family amidase